MSQIPLSEAVAMTKRYRTNMDQILAPAAQATDVLAYCETFTSDEITQLLAVYGCVYFRIYYGMSEDTKVHAILVPVDDKGQDIIHAGVGNGGGDDSFILEDAERCPTSCPPDSPLTVDA